MKTATFLFAAFGLFFMAPQTATGTEGAHCADWMNNATKAENDIRKLEEQRKNATNRYNKTGGAIASRGGKAAINQQKQGGRTSGDMLNAGVDNSNQCMQEVGPVSLNSDKLRPILADFEQQYTTCSGATERFQQLQKRNDQVYNESTRELNRCNGQGYRSKKLAGENNQNADNMGQGAGDQAGKGGDDKKGKEGGGPAGGGAPPGGGDQKPKEDEAKKDEQEAPCPNGFVKNKDKLCEPANHQQVVNQTESLKLAAEQQRLQQIEQENQRLKNQYIMDQYNRQRQTQPR